MRNIYSRSSKGVIADSANKEPMQFQSRERAFRDQLSNAPAGDEKMEQCCETATKLRDDVFWWSFCEEAHED